MTNKVDWDQSIKNLRSMFHELNKADRREKDRLQRLKDRQKLPEASKKAPQSRCTRCKSFCKEQLCTKCLKK